MLESVDPGLCRVSGSHRPEVPGDLEPEPVRLLGDRAEQFGCHRLADFDRRRTALVEEAHGATGHVGVLEADEVVTPRRGSVEPVAGEVDPRAPGSAGFDLVARRRDPLEVVADVLDRRDAVHQEQVAHPFEVVDVHVDEAWQHELPVEAYHGCFGIDRNRSAGRRPRRCGRPGSR